eukprot:2352012-Amphidinium_carterae.1
MDLASSLEQAFSVNQSLAGPRWGRPTSFSPSLTAVRVIPETTVHTAVSMGPCVFRTSAFPASVLSLAASDTENVVTFRTLKLDNLSLSAASVVQRHPCIEDNAQVFPLQGNCHAVRYWMFSDSSVDEASHVVEQSFEKLAWRFLRLGPRSAVNTIKIETTSCETNCY